MGELHRRTQRGRGPAHRGREGPGPREHPGGGRHRVRTQPAGKGGLQGQGTGDRPVPEETHRPGPRDPRGKDGRVLGHIPKPIVHRLPAAPRGVGVEPETVEPGAPGDLRDRPLQESAPLARGRHKQKAGGLHHAGRPGGQVRRVNPIEGQPRNRDAGQAVPGRVQGNQPRHTEMEGTGDGPQPVSGHKLRSRHGTGMVHPRRPGRGPGSCRRR